MPVEYVPYYPQPIEGQAVLDNFTRTRRLLAYRDNDKVLRRIARGMPRYELQEVETVGQPPEKDANLVIRGECLSACAHLKEQGVQVDLVYIDPPFASGADYAKKIYIRRNPKVTAAIARAEEELPDDQLRGFEEKMYGDIWTKEDYLNWMYENLMAIKAVMSDNASIYVHLDWHVGHYVKVLMDEVFGEDSFINEIVWQRFNFHADAQRFGIVHESIFFYSKNSDYVFNKQYAAFKPSYIASHFTNKDADGKVYRLDNPTAPSHGRTGKALRFGDRFITPPAGSMWRYSQANIDKLLGEGRIVFTNKGMPAVKRYLDDLEGAAVHSLWTDVGSVNSQSDERSDYATQKPESLLDRIVSASSNVNMLVADFFGGSGVTAAVAHRLGRRFIHVDVGLNSIQTTRDRLQAADAAFRVLDVQDGVALFRNPAQTMDKLRSLITGLRRDESELTGDFWAGALNDSRLGLVPVYLPDLKDHTTKVLDIPLMSRIINVGMPDLPEKVKKVVVYFVDIENPVDLDAFIKDNASPDCVIELRDLKELLSEVVLADEAQVSVTKDNIVTFDSFFSDRLQQKIATYNARHGLNSFPDGALLDADNQPPEPKPVKGFKPIEISADGLELIEWVSADCAAAEGTWHSDAEIKIDKRGFVIRDGQKTKTFWDAKLPCPNKPLRVKIRSIAGDETVLSLGGVAEHTTKTATIARSAEKKDTQRKSAGKKALYSDARRKT